jgi:hypothetical protein
MSIDFLIESVTVCSITYFAVMFVAGIGRRSVSTSVEPVEVPVGEFCCDAAPEDAAIVEAFLNRPRFVDNVVPFIRAARPVRPAQRPAPTDRELIELAKATGFPGAKKWSFSRKLNQQQRESLLKVWEVKAA